MTAQTTPTLAAAVEQLARHRVLLADVNFEIESKRAEFEQSIADERTRCGLIKAFIAEDEAIVREMALASGEKHPHPAVTVKDISGLEYDDAPALDWALAHHMALALNKRLFEKHVKADPTAFMEFVTVTSTQRADIATDLSKYLEPS